MKSFGCPHCGHASTSEHWDATTREIEGIKDNQPFMSCADDPEELKEVDAFFRCPICEDQVNATELLAENENNEN